VNCKGYEKDIEIKLPQYSFKVVDFLLQNWFLIDETTDNTTAGYFFGDTFGGRGCV